MISETIFKRAFWTLAITGFLNFVAIKLELYWTVWWIDMVVHFFGGLTVGLATLWLSSRFFDFRKWSTLRLSTTAILGAITIGVLWELYELYFGITSLSDGIHYVTDTSSDILMDTIGGIVGFFYVNNLLKKINNIEN